MVEADGCSRRPQCRLKLVETGLVAHEAVEAGAVQVIVGEPALELRGAGETLLAAKVGRGPAALFRRNVDAAPLAFLQGEQPPQVSAARSLARLGSDAELV